MEQERLRELEDKCIQEYPPACTAACPVHVDVRAMAVEMGQGNPPAALKILRKSVPFPGIISRICDQPCHAICKRKEAGEAIAIAALERACVDLVTSPEKVAVQPRRNKTTAIIGGGLSGLTVAYDLARKGYGIVIFEMKDRLGGNLWQISENLLPPFVISNDLGVLNEIGVDIRLNTRVDAIQTEGSAFIVAGESFDAIFVGTGADSPSSFSLDLDNKGQITIDPVSAVTSREGIFAGGDVVEKGTSAIQAVFHGRRAAVSIDRYMQRVSLTAARVREGAYETRLFTSLEGIDPKPVVPMTDPENGYTLEESVREAKRCIQCQCMECVKVCEYLKQYGSYPKRYVREIYNNLSIVQGERQKNQFINSCSLCNLCGEICPEDLDMGVVCLESRRTMVSQKRMPPSAHDFALRDMVFSNGELFAFSRSQPGTESSRYVFFPGCQLSASSPEDVEKMYAYLVGRSGNGLDGKVGLMLRCCGAPAEWAGRVDLFEESKREFLAEHERLGKPELILACSSCYHIFKTCYPDIKITSLWTLLDEIGLPQSSDEMTKSKIVAMHDPCTTRYETDIQDSARHILDRLGYQIQELPLNRETTECCSYGGLMWLVNRKLSQDVIQRRLDESPLDYVTYCIMCRDLYARRGKPTLHLLDLVFHPSEAGQLSKRKGPDYSQRHENRMHLKKKLLKEFWGEDMDGAERYRSINLTIPEKVRDILNDRLILEEDLQQVIEYAERTGRRLLNKENGHYLAYYQPAGVTYWVEYSPADDSFVIHNAYSHRMVIEEGVQK